MLRFKLMQQRGIQPNILTYSSMARGYALKGAWRQAERLGESLEGAGAMAIGLKV